MVGDEVPKGCYSWSALYLMLLDKMEALSYCFSAIPACPPGWSWTLAVSPSKLSSISYLAHGVSSQQLKATETLEAPPFHGFSGETGLETSPRGLVLCRKTDGGMCGHVPNEGSCSVIDVPHCKPCPITFALGALSTEVPQSPAPPQPRNPSCEAPICTGFLSTRTLGKHGVLRMGLASPLPPPRQGFLCVAVDVLKLTV